jgi:hypothetical protein
MMWCLSSGNDRGNRGKVFDDDDDDDDDDN